MSDDIEWEMYNIFRNLNKTFIVLANSDSVSTVLVAMSV